MQQRLLALDVFRGLTVALMILVNNPGSWAHIYPPLRHAPWHGLTAADLVFPFFLFIVGVAMALSFARRQGLGARQGDLVRKIVTRAGVIFLLGLFLNGFPFTGGAGQWASLRLWGVLQRIAACYLIAGLAVALLPGRRALPGFTLLLLLVYELGMRLPLVEGWGAGSFALEDSFARWLDLRLWGAQHLHGGAGVPFDPEGLWSTLPATVTTLLGYFAGQLLGAAWPLDRKLRLLALAGVVLAGLGVAAHQVEPVNKQLWTASYAAVTGGLALLALAGSVHALDVRGWRRGTLPAVVFGSNALVVFVGSGVVARLLVLARVDTGGGAAITLKHWLHTRLFAGWAAPDLASLLFAVAFVGVWLGLLWILYARKIFIKI